MPFTTRGSNRMFDIVFRGAAAPSQFNVMYFRATNTPTRATKTAGELVEITSGNGYSTGGIPLARNTTDFPSITEDDVNFITRLNAKLIEVLASGGTIPASGVGAAWGALVDNNVTIANRETWFYWALPSVVITPEGFKLVADGLAMRLLAQS